MRRSALLVVGALAGALAGTMPAQPVVAATPSVTVTVSTPREVGKALTVGGVVTDENGDPVDGAMLTVSRTDPSGGPTPVGTTTSGQDGGYSLPDTPKTRGSTTYTVTWTNDPAAPGGVSGSATVSVAGEPTTVSINADKVMVSAGHSVHLTADVDPADGRTVTIVAKPYRRSSQQLTSQSTPPASADTQVSASYVMHRRTTFTLSVPGDSTYAPATASITVTARAVVHESLRGGYRTTSDGVRLYHKTGNPELVADLTPALQNACLYFRAQRRYGGQWHRVAVSGCIRTDSAGEASGRLTGDHSVGDLYRVRAEWRGSYAVAARHGVWLRVEFRR